MSDPNQDDLKNRREDSEWHIGRNNNNHLNRQDAKDAKRNDNIVLLRREREWQPLFLALLAPWRFQ